MSSYMICQWTGPGQWVPMAHISKPNQFAAAWRDLHEHTPGRTFRGFERLGTAGNPAWQVADHDNVLTEVEAWSMLPLDAQNKLAHGEQP